MLVADEGVEPSRPSNLEVSMLYKGIPHARAIGHILLMLNFYFCVRTNGEHSPEAVPAVGYRCEY